jgi:tight adherence protein B
MDLDNILWIVLFVGILVLIELGYYTATAIWDPEKRQIKKRLRILAASKLEDPEIDIVKKKSLSGISWLRHLLQNFPLTDKVLLLIYQSGLRLNVGLFILISLCMAAIGFLTGGFLTQERLLLYRSLVEIGSAVLLGLLPLLFVLMAKAKRMEKFNSQLPEALDLIARSLRAGHAFSAGLKIVADEMRDPIGTEFYRALNEINFGVSVPDALKNLSNRIDCPDLKIFTISVIIQRETGGNLAEILKNNGKIIRERFKFQGKVRVLAAPGKLSAIIITILPFALAFILSIVNPNYLNHLIVDPLGQMALVFGLVLMLLGIIVLKKMVVIKV